MKDIKFDKALKKLKEINEKLENGDLDIEEALELYKQGVELYKQCKQKLEKAKATFKTIGGE